MKIKVRLWFLLCLATASCAAEVGDWDDAESDDVHAEALSVAAAGQPIASYKDYHMCMGVSGASDEIGTDIRLFTCVIADNQRWYIGGTGDLWTIRNEGTGRCLGVEDDFAGTHIRQYKCNDASKKQHWINIGKTVGIREKVFMNENSGLCIGLDWGKTDHNTQLKQFVCDTQAPNQRWH